MWMTLPALHLSPRWRLTLQARQQCAQSRSGEERRRSLDLIEAVWGRLGLCSWIWAVEVPWAGKSSQKSTTIIIITIK